MDFSSIWRWLAGEVPPARYEDQAIARQVYADYMRAQILGLKPAEGATLLTALQAESADGTLRAAAFPELMGVETRLVAALDDDMVEQAYWIVRERFNRVAPASVIEEHSRWAPPGLVEPDERMPITGAADPVQHVGSNAQTEPADDADAVEPTIDAAGLDSEAAVREAEMRHAAALQLAATPEPDHSDAPAEGTTAPADAAQDDPTAALDAPAGPLPEDR